MVITVAGEKKEVKDGLTLTELIEQENVEMPEYVTVSINEEFIATSIYGFMAFIVSFADFTFAFPISAVLWIICLCRLERSTSSASTIPMIPTPAAARYMAAGAPRPPAPMISTLPFKSFFCPFAPTSFKMMWRE